MPIDVFSLSGAGVFLMERLYYFSESDANQYNSRYGK